MSVIISNTWATRHYHIRNTVTRRVTLTSMTTIIGSRLRCWPPSSRERSVWRWKWSMWPTKSGSPNGRRSQALPSASVSCHTREQDGTNIISPPILLSPPDTESKGVWRIITTLIVKIPIYIYFTWESLNWWHTICKTTIKESSSIFMTLPMIKLGGRL